MNRFDFLKELENRLTFLDDDKRFEILEKYRKEIDSRMENGEFEEQIIISFGSTEDIIKKVYAEHINVINKIEVVPEELHDDNHFTNITINITTEDVYLHIGHPFKVTTPRGKTNNFDCNIFNNELTIRTRKNVLGGLYNFLFGRETEHKDEKSHINIYLPERGYKEVSIRTTLGNIAIIGDIDVDSLKITTSSGRIEADEIVSKTSEITTTSGLVKIHKLVSSRLEISNYSGMINFDTEKSYRSKYETYSGDIKIRTHDVAEKTEFNSYSGDITIGMETAPKFKAKSYSGDFKISLSSDKKLRLKTKTGIINAPKLRGKGKFKISSFSGNIDIVR